MNKTLIVVATGLVEAVIALPEDWTGAEDEWQVPDERALIDETNCSPGDTWDGTQIIKAPPVLPEPPFFVSKSELWERCTTTESRAITKFLHDAVAEVAHLNHEVALDFEGEWKAAITIEISGAKWLAAVGFMRAKGLISQETHDALLLP